jgi:hypothetical protein
MDIDSDVIRRHQAGAYFPSLKRFRSNHLAFKSCRKDGGTSGSDNLACRFGVVEESNGLELKQTSIDHEKREHWKPMPCTVSIEGARGNKASLCGEGALPERVGSVWKESCSDI